MSTVDDRSGQPAERAPEPLDQLIAALPSWQLAVMRFNDAVARRLGIAPSDLQCLFVLDRRGRAYPGEIARAVELTSGATSRMIERLLQAGMVTREHSGEDRRRVHVSMTPAARDSLHSVYDPLDAALRDLLLGLDDHTRNELLRFVTAAETLTSELGAAVSRAG